MSIEAKVGGEVSVLVLSSYGEMGASSRLRMFQYFPLLRELGVRCRAVPLLRDSHLERRFAGRSISPFATLASYLGRLRQLLTAGQYDVLWIEKELFPWLPALFERLLAALGIPFVVEYDDAVFHRYDRHSNAILRRLLGAKVDSVMRQAACVIAGNEYIAERAQRAGARQIEIVPTCIDVRRYRGTSQERSGSAGKLAVGWIGSPITLPYLVGIASAVREVEADIELHVIGATMPAMHGLRCVSYDWTEATEVQHIQRFDVGVMPLPDDDWERGKCGYKLIQYMGCAKPVVGSPVGVNSKIVRHGQNGFQARTHEQWTEALQTLAVDPQLRSDMGKRGREDVELYYSIQKVAPRLARVLCGCARKAL